MTTPGGNAPDGAYVIGSRYGQDQTEAGVRARVQGRALAGYENAQGEWRGFESTQAELASQIRDGQLDLNNRLDLLEGVEGYCSLFMGLNWEVPGPNTRRILPFDTQLGPNKGAVPYDKGIKLLTKGLWRADAHVSFYPLASGSPVSAKVYVSVWGLNAATAYTESEYSIVLSTAGPETAAFSRTFVIPADDSYFVRIEVQHPRSLHKVYGGTLRSALSVNKWDNGTSNNNDQQVVPDGGTLP